MDPEKHTRYLSAYKSNDYFWGLGIENETYLQFSRTYMHPTSGIYTNHKPERYSVNYYVGLDPEYKTHLKELFPIDKMHYQIPIYMNAHSLQKTDVSGNHVTTYEKVPNPNPKFLGKTIHELLCEFNPAYFKDKYKVNYMFDGDTIEFMTQNYYKTNTKQVLEELIKEKAQFLEELNIAFKALNIFPEFGTLLYPTRNEPFVSFLNNNANIAIFNNGTYHINITLPTQLGSDALPLDDAQFINSHRTLIRYIQLLEPFLIVKYGTKDPFSEVSPKYSRASQRCAVSRYIGIGTYDTDVMETGKILNMDLSGSKLKSLEHWWYNIYNKTSNYIELPKIGVDINFRKHGVHGIEIRFLDWFPEAKLDDLLTLLVHLCDYSLENNNVSNPIYDEIWNNFVVRALQQGDELELEEEEYKYFKSFFKIVDLNTRSINKVYDQISKYILSHSGICVKNMLPASTEVKCFYG
jgi:hypothetical protein